MSDDFLPQWRPEPEAVPPNALERLLAKAVDDPSRHGEMFRKLLEAELFLLIPAKDFQPGDHQLAEHDPFEWCAFRDADGPFTPVFTSLAVAEERVRKLPPGPSRAIVGMEGKVLFGFLVQGQTPVRVVGAKAVEVTLQPEALHALLAGKLTDARPSSGPAQSMTLHPIPADDLPPRLVDGVRSFCDKRRVPLGVYAFHAEEPETGEPNTGEIRLILWLRATDNSFFNDFSLMAQKLAPGFEMVLGVVTPEQAAAVEFLSGRPPLWPVLGEVC